MRTNSLHKSEKGNLVMTPRTTSEMLTGRWGWMFAPARDCIPPPESADLFRAFLFLGLARARTHYTDW